MVDYKAQPAGSSVREEGGAYVFENRLEQIEREQAESRKRDEGYKKNQINIARQQTRLTLALVVVGTLALSVAGWQADQARRSADAAVVASVGAREQSRLDQRAWVGVVGVTPPPHEVAGARVYVKEGEFLDLSAFITNSGKTPGLNTTTRINFRTLAGDQPFEPAYGEITEASRPVVQPGMRYELSYNNITIAGGNKRLKLSKKKY